MLDVSMGAILSGIVLGGIGFVMFMHGKREADFGVLGGGIALSVLPFILHGVLTLWLVSAAVFGGVLLLKKYGGGSTPMA